jgi:hypothetical protein
MGGILKAGSSCRCYLFFCLIQPPAVTNCYLILDPEMGGTKQQDLKVFCLQKYFFVFVLDLASPYMDKLENGLWGSGLGVMNSLIMYPLSLDVPLHLNAGWPCPVVNSSPTNCLVGGAWTIGRLHEPLQHANWHTWFNATFISLILR